MKLAMLVIAGSLVLGLAGDVSAGKATQVFEDPIGDAGIEGGTAVGKNPIPGFDRAGFDLVSGEIVRKGSDLEFKVTSAAMPPTGSLPEGATFLWRFEVDGQRFRFTIKSQDVGKPDPLAQEGIDRLGRLDLEGHFRLEKCRLDGEVAGIGVTRCKLIAFEDGSFDPATKSFAVTIPLGDLEASAGSVIGVDTAGSPRCQPCWITHLAERTSPPGFILDGTENPISYRIPKR
jgi:hypothetical protein